LKKLLSILIVLASAHLRAAPDPVIVYATLLKFEGLRLTPYQEKGGSDWIVGIGHNLSARRQKVRAYSNREVYQFFQSDYAEMVKAARRLVVDFDELPEPAQLVVINLLWSVGPAGFAKFKNFRLALKYRAFNHARIELIDSKWASQVQPERLDWAVKSLEKL
jgi:GH24 family phage-related lysozyme (muramidase)